VSSWLKRTSPGELCGSALRSWWTSTRRRRSSKADLLGKRTDGQEYHIDCIQSECNRIDCNQYDYNRYGINRRMIFIFGVIIMHGDTLTEDAPPKSIPNEVQLRPSAWQAEFEFNSIIEWKCGNCHKNIYYSCWNATYCPHCGSPIFNFPRQKLNAPQHRGWSYNAQKSVKCDNNKGKIIKSHRASTGAKRKI